jgi:hypothetical protein
MKPFSYHIYTLFHRLLGFFLMFYLSKFNNSKMHSYMFVKQKELFNFSFPLG